MLDGLRAKLDERLSRGDVGLRMIFDALVAVSALTKGRFDADSARARTITRGSTGAYEYVFTGEGGGRWFCEIDEGTMRWHRGAHPSPRASVEVPAIEVWKLLTGTTSFVTLEMTGKIRTRGDAHASMMFGALVGRIRDLRRARGQRGRAIRAYLDVALRLSGTRLSFEEKNE